MSNTETEAKNPPVAKIRVGGVTASIWENKGEKGTTYNATYLGSYKDGEGRWHNTTSFGPGSSLELAKAADLAHTKILELLNGRE